MGKLIDIDGLSEFKYKLLNTVGANNGIAGLDSSGKVPSSQLPSYVDDVLEYSKRSNFPATGETGKIYVDTQKNDTYRWSGSTYVQITNGSLDATLVSSSAVSGASTVEQALTSLNDNVTRSVYLELPVTLTVANWSSSSPYTYTVTDSRINNAVGVEVEFNDGTSDTTAPYISYEKVSGGVQFTSTVKPTASIGVTIKLNQSRTEAYTDLTADMVASEAVQNTENVEEALSTLNDQIANLNMSKKVTNFTTAWNNTTAGRITFFETTSASSDNPPTGSGNVWQVLTYKESTTAYGWQIATHTNSRDIYMRVRVDDVFYSWRIVCALEIVTDFSASSTVSASSRPWNQINYSTLSSGKMNTMKMGNSIVCSFYGVSAKTSSDWVGQFHSDYYPAKTFYFPVYSNGTIKAGYVNTTGFVYIPFSAVGEVINCTLVLPTNVYV